MARVFGEPLSSWPDAATPSGLANPCFDHTQGSSCLATLGSVPESLWDSPPDGMMKTVLTPIDPQPSTLNSQPRMFSRRDFLAASSLLALAAVVPGCKTAEEGPGHEPIIDIHQHLGYSGRSGEVLLAHQRAMGVTTSILHPACRPVNSASTHNGLSNGRPAGSRIV